MKTIIAIDPGASGGLAVRDFKGDVSTWPMCETDGDLRQLLGEINSASKIEAVECVAVIEDLVKFAGKGQAGASAIVYGRNHGFIEGVLAGLGIRIERVRCQKWQKELGLGTRGELSKTEWKNKAKAMAQRLYPALNGAITLKTADALLILEWAIRRGAKDY